MSASLCNRHIVIKTDHKGNQPTKLKRNLLIRSKREAMQPLLNKGEDESSEAWEQELVRGGWQWGLVIWEWSNLWHQSWASVAIQLSAFMIGTVSMMFAGRLGTLELAGVAIIGVSVQSVEMGVSVSKQVYINQCSSAIYEPVGIMNDKNYVSKQVTCF